MKKKKKKDRDKYDEYFCLEEILSQKKEKRKKTISEDEFVLQVNFHGLLRGNYLFKFKSRNVERDLVCTLFLMFWVE